MIPRQAVVLYDYNHYRTHEAATQATVLDLLPLIYAEICENPGPDEIVGEFDLWCLYPDTRPDPALSYAAAFYYRSERRRAAALVLSPTYPFDLCLAQFHLQPRWYSQRVMLSPIVVPKLSREEVLDIDRSHLVWYSADHWKSSQRLKQLEDLVVDAAPNLGITRIYLFDWVYQGMIRPISGVEIIPLPTEGRHSLSDIEYARLIQGAKACIVSCPDQHPYIGRRAASMGIPVIAMFGESEFEVYLGPESDLFVLNDPTTYWDRYSRAFLSFNVDVVQAKLMEYLE